jgi:hypothetical protein
MNGNEMVTVEKRSKPSVGVEVDSWSAEDGYKDSEIRDLERQLKQLDQLEFEFDEKIPSINELWNFLIVHIV